MFEAGSAFVELGVEMGGLTKGLRQARNETETFADRAEDRVSRLDSVFSKVGSAAGAFGKVLGGIAVAGVAGLGAGFLGAATAGLSFNSTLENTEAKMLAFTGSAEETAKVMEMVRDRAASTPFAFNDMADATAALLPVAKQSGAALEDLIGTAEILGALNPAEGLSGAAFALREAMSGDFLSIVERFNLPKQRLNELKAEGVPAIEAIRIAMQEMGVDASLVTNLAGTMTGRWSTFVDTLQGLSATATAPLFEGLSTGLGDLQGVLDANSEKLTAFATVIGTGLGNAFTSIIGFVTGSVIPTFTMMQGLWTTAGEVADSLAGRIGFVADALMGFDNSEDAGPFERLATSIAEASEAIRQGDLVGAFQVMLSGIRGIGEQILPIVQGIGITISTWISTQAATWGPQLATWALAFGQWAIDAIPVVVTSLQTLGTNIITWITTTAATLAPQFATWATVFGQWAIDAIPIILTNLAQSRGAMLSWIAETLPQWVAGLATFIAPAGQWVLDAIPTLLSNLGTFLQTIVDQTLSFGIAVAEAFAPMAIAAVVWVSDALPGLTENLGQFFNTMVNWVVDSIPGWSEQLLSLGKKLTQWVLDALPDLAANLGTAAGNLIAWIAKTALDVIPELAKLALQFTEWVITDVIPALPGVLAQIWDAINIFIDTMVADAKPALAALGLAFVAWVETDVLPFLGAKLGEIATAIWTWVTDTAATATTKAATIGQSIIDGIGTAISNGVQGLIDIATGILGRVLDAATGVLKSNSPSKVWRDQVGLPIVQGLALGISKNSGLATDAVDGVLSDMQNVDPSALALNTDIQASAEASGSQGAFTLMESWNAELLRGLPKFADDFNTFFSRMGEEGLIPWLGATNDYLSISANEWMTSIGMAITSASAPADAAYAQGAAIVSAFNAGLSSVPVAGVTSDFTRMAVPTPQAAPQLNLSTGVTAQSGGGDRSIIVQQSFAAGTPPDIRAQARLGATQGVNAALRAMGEG